MPETADVLEVVGTVGAGGTGIAGAILLIRAMWKLISGQLQEQRHLLNDAREGTEKVRQERDNLRTRNEELKQMWNEDADRKDNVIDGLRDQLDREYSFSRRLAEYASHLRSKLIEECGQAPADLPPYPKRRSVEDNGRPD